MISRFHGLSEQHKGVIFAVIAHMIWGAMAVYFGFMRHIPALEIAANRGVWSLPIAALIIWQLGQFADVWQVLKNPKYLLTLSLTGAIIVFNWSVYIWSIEHGRTLEASLGYFINPLLNVLAGYFFLSERFTRAQMLAIVLAAIGVLVQTVASGAFPLIGLTLGGSFCIYGLIRKTVPVGATQGFMVEIVLIFVPMLMLEAWLYSNGETHFGRNTLDTLLLVGCGAFTTGALVFYAASLKRIRYSTAGVLQYLSPTLVFLTAVFMFGEHMDRWKLLSFGFIWVALAIYTVAALREDARQKADIKAYP